MDLLGYTAGHTIILKRIGTRETFYWHCVVAGHCCVVVCDAEVNRVGKRVSSNKKQLKRCHVITNLALIFQLLLCSYSNRSYFLKDRYLNHRCTRYKKKKKTRRSRRRWDVQSDRESIGWFRPDQKVTRIEMKIGGIKIHRSVGFPPVKISSGGHGSRCNRTPGNTTRISLLAVSTWEETAS